MDEKPICDFSGLKKCLIEKGYHIGKAEPWRKIDSEEVNLKKGQLECTDEGIFLIDDDGFKHQVFLYKRRYKLRQYGKPRFHICKCETIEKFLNGNDIPYYKFTKNNLDKKIKLPPMAEGMFNIDDNIYILFENSSDTYFYAFPKLRKIIKF